MSWLLSRGIRLEIEASLIRRLAIEVHLVAQVTQTAGIFDHLHVFVVFTVSFGSFVCRGGGSFIVNADVD